MDACMQFFFTEFLRFRSDLSPMLDRQAAVIPPPTEYIIVRNTMHKISLKGVYSVSFNDLFEISLVGGGNVPALRITFNVGSRTAF